MSGAAFWPQTMLDQQLADPELALSVLELHLCSDKWVHHRLHQVTFQDDTTVRHCFTVDLTVPKQSCSVRGPETRRVRLLPLDLLPKQNLVNFEICDQAGKSLSYLTSSQVRILTAVMLTEYAEGLLSEPLPDGIGQHIKDLVTADPIDAEAQEDWEHVIFADSDVQAVKNQLDKMVEFTSILKRLTSNHILLVPVEAVPGTRLKMRYCLDYPVEYVLKEDPKEGLGEQLGWRCTRIDFPLEAAAETEIYHFEVEDPPGVDLAMAAIFECPAPSNGTTPEPTIHDWRPGGVPRLNLRARNVQRGSRVVARVDIRTSLHGWLPAFVTCSWVLALLLGIGAWRLPYLMDLGSQTEGTDPVGVAAALLLFITGVIARLLHTSGEHGLTRKVLFRLRQLALLTAFLPVVAVVGLLFIPLAQLQWIWVGLAAAALVAAMLSTASYILPKPLSSHSLTKPPKALTGEDKLC